MQNEACITTIDNAPADQIMLLGETTRTASVSVEQPQSAPMDPAREGEGTSSRSNRYDFEIPNDATLDAMQATEDGAEIRYYDDEDELFADLGI